KEGDAVTEDQPLVEVMTDKATVVIPSPKRGRVSRTHGREGEIAKVHQPLVTLELEVGAASAPATAARPAEVERAAPVRPLEAVSPPSEGVKVLATPVTRRMAREHGVDLAAISGSGPQGRVTKVDVLAAISIPSRARAQGSAALALEPSAEDRRVPLRGLRKRIAEKMVRSKFTAPHFTFVEEVDATELSAVRSRMNDALAASGETLKLSFLPFICKATLAALRKYPTLNANFDEAAQELVVRGAYNFGIAVATDDGLTVPVLKDVDRLPLGALAAEIGRLAAAARDKKLKADELSGGTFTLTSLGPKAGLFATPILNHPEVGILGIHRIRKRPAVIEDQVVVREMMHLSLSSDHRVVDGAMAADFVYEIIRYLERPELLFLGAV
ncbi:MAG TPA: dihydrolipoamide acetyltransferase family protein, partial [Myxococcaceae bacterium]|nr:dihydrolipoamide acetyltransferase family protein [Myxococcaceae bacterium]